MSEINEQPIATEGKKDPRVVERVKTAMQTAWEKIKKDHADYTEIRNGIQDRLTMKGIYKHQVEQMDKITDRIYGSNGLNFIQEASKTATKIHTRLSAGINAGSAAVADTMYNVATWPVRKPAHLSTDTFKRSVFAANELGVQRANALSDEALRKRVAIDPITRAILRGSFRAPAPAKV